MTVTAEEARLIRRDENKRNRARAQMWRKENERIFKKYMEFLKDNPEEVAVSLVCEQYKCTPRRIRNVLARKSGFTSPAMTSLSEALILQRIGKLINDVEDARIHSDEELDKIEQTEEKGEDWLEIEKTTGTGKDADGETVKHIPIAEAKKRWLENKIKYTQEFFSAVKSLIPQTVLNQTIDQRRVVDQYDDADLDRQLDEALRQKPNP